MRKFIVGLITGLLLAALALFIVSFALVRLGERRPVVAEGSTLLVKLEEELPERPQLDLPLPMFQSQSASTVLEVWGLFRRAASDNRIKAVVFMPGRLSIGWAKAQELRESLLAFRRSGKPLIAWLRTPGSREYYIATAADRICLAPEDFLDTKGLRAELMYFRGTLDKLGIQAHVEHMGKYKDAGDMLTRTSMSPETREVMNSVLDEVYGNLLSTVAAARKKQPEDIRAAFDEGPLLAAQAREKGLVDELRYEDEVYGDLRKRLGTGELKKISHREYLRAAAPSALPRRRIAFIVGEGTILRGGGDGLSDAGLLSGGFVKLLRQVGSDAGIRGVIVRIDSPGGDAIASDDILREMKLLSAKKPLVISMSDVAASGGYYISMTGDPVLAYPGTFTGSIGVVFGKLNLHGLYDKLGIQKDILLRGRNAGIDSDYQPLTDAGRKKLQESIRSIYDGFLKRVADARRRKPEQIEPLAQGRVWLGSQAKDRGLVDQLGGLDAAVELVKQKAGIGKDEQVRLVPYPPRRTLFEYLLSRSQENIFETRLRELFPGVPVSELRLLASGGLLRWMPYRVEIR